MKPLAIYSAFLFLLPAFLLTSCFSPTADNVEDLNDASATTQLKVTTRAATGEVSYPILVNAYDNSGSLKGQQTINSENESISLHLNEGAYHITAISGHGNYSEPSSYSQLTSLIGIPAAGYATSPLMMGGADVVLSNGSASVNVVMTYRVASLDLSLSAVPSDVTAVSVGVSQQYKAVDMSGDFKDKCTANVTCRKSGDVWTSDRVYLMPGTGSTTTLTISLTNAEGQVSYSYELAEPLAAAVPYTIKGTYVESTAPYITGVITIEGWQDERTIDFEFGGNSTNGGISTVVPTDEVTTIPEACSDWNGHVVALVENATETSADLILLALHEMKDVRAPAAENYEMQMQDSVNAYIEGDLKDWTVPTEDEARSLKKTYGGNYDELNLVIDNLKGDSISVSTSSSNARYLCADGNKTFNFAEKGSITTAGTSVKYRLRLVKRIHVIKKE